ncbi:MAG: rod shape-determining protein MreC [Candidatus Latescibacterota bacterium]|nr:rod shape-determining protein MreC [Candidatus Latescibacterota bacterium]
MLQRNSDYLCIGLAVVLSLTLMGLPPERQEAIAHGLRSAAWTTGQWAFARVIRFARGEQRSRYLSALNVQLAIENMRLREAAAENLRLRQVLQFRQRDQVRRVIPAEVIARDPDQLFDKLVVNAGSDLGIQEDWPVVTPDGLVGHVDEVRDHSSVVQLIFGSRVSALVQESRAHGIVSPLAGGNRFELRYAEAANLIEVGNRIVSSGLGGRYPKGITVGYITEVRERERDPLLKEVFLESEVDFWGLEEVFVIHSASDSERPESSP